MAGPADSKSLASALAHYALTALAIGMAWWWLGRPVQLPPSPLALVSGGKLYCVSYAPFRGSQDPLVPGTMVSATQIDEDLTILSRYTDCIRTYSNANGLDQIPAIAQRHGLKMLMGLWLANSAEFNRQQIATAIDLAKKYPDVISAVVVGNEVLLRGELSATDLGAIIREVKSQVSMPVTYADVWEFWLRYSDLQNDVDFVTIHILPYWEDVPLPASAAAAHVDDIRKKVAAAIPNKEIVIGEIGWPSAGRMREAARPSPSNQARVIAETLALGHRENFRVNVIEAFDQPWKRALEGSTGRYWGIFSRATQAPKFSFSGSVSDHPRWRARAAAGILLAGFAFAGAWLAGRGKTGPPLLWTRVAVIAFLACVLFGWALETIPVDSIGIGGWVRMLALAATAGLAPIVCAAASAARRPLPSFAALLGQRKNVRDGLDIALGAVFIALTLLSVETALGLVFDPRYRNLPFAPQSAAVFAYLILMVSTPRPAGARPAAETLAAAVLAVSAVYIAINETFANWQAIWLCAGLLGLAFILAQARDAPD
ncbi:MAG TPA: beta-(1-6) glucans synthase [Xanthobacteraceae bacterium]|nr:beta-(1-6) glucans synthase [Xanthobacteraceae bacterium]